MNAEKKTKILISGGTGMIGRQLMKSLPAESYEFAVLSRQDNISGIRSFKWDINTAYIDPLAMEFADVVVHLAGENISSGKWTDKQKKKILDSRVNSGKLISKAIIESENKPKMLISASAVGYYGAITSKKIFVEQDKPGEDFMAEVVIKWEGSTSEIEKLDISNYKLRIGIVLDKNGGALEKIASPVKSGLGSALGSGLQWMPWVSIDDLIGIIQFTIENNIPNGVYNAVAPQHVNNKTFMRQLSRVLGRPFFFPNVPSVLLKLMLGEMSDIILKGSRVSSKKIIDTGFVFKDVDLYETLNRIYGKT